MISGILLAAGGSSRMQGAFKPLLKWGKRTVVGECVYQMTNSKLAEIFVVIGYRGLDIRQSLAGTGVQYAVNDDYQKGMLSSIKAGLGMLTSNEDAFMLALVDQPMIKAELIDELIEAYGSGDHGILVPTYDGKPGHPVIISTKYTDDILQLDDDIPGGMRAFIDAHRDDCLELPVDMPDVLEDIDLPEDYERLSRQVQPLYEYHKWQP